MRFANAKLSMSDLEMNVFRPPLARTAGVLDRALYSKTINLAAARVRDNRDITRYRQTLEKSKDLLRVERIAAVRTAPEATSDANGARCLLLQPKAKADGELFNAEYRYTTVL